MKLLMSKELGYCYGVRDAVNEVVKLTKESDEIINTFGPLIHNSRAIQELENQYKIKAINKIEEIENKTLAIRAHGIAPKTLKTFTDKGVNIIDTTCPFVMKTQKTARKMVEDGYFIIILGKRKHPEVIGIAGHVEGKCLIVQNQEDLKKLTKKSKIGIVFQSTITTGDVGYLIPQIIEYAKETKIIKTICGITARRQIEAKELSRQTDLMIVIGGKHSSNSRKLTEICKKEGVKAIQIESANEIENIDFNKIKTIGLTTGTSTPKILIDEVIKKLELLN